MSYLRFSLMLLALYVCGGQTDPAPLDEININFNLIDNDMGPMGNENVETGRANMEEGMESGAEHYPKPTWEPNDTVYCAQGGPSSDPSSGGKPCHVDDGHFCCGLQCCPPNTGCGPTPDGTCIPEHPNTWHQRHENMKSGMANMEEDSGNMESGAEHYPRPTWEPTWEPNDIVYCAAEGPSSDPSSGGKPCHVDDGHFCCKFQCCAPNTHCGHTPNGTCIPEKPNTWHQRHENMETGMANMEEDSGNMESGAEHYPKPTWEPNHIVYCNGKNGTSTDPSSGGTKCNLGDGHHCCDKECCAPNQTCAYTKPGKCVPEQKPKWYHR